MTGLHHHINLSFLILNHTKFSLDWCFGPLKRRFRRARVACLNEIVVNDSSETNTAQLVGTQSGEVVVSTYNWSTMFAGRLQKLKNIKKYHHFSISASAPGSVKVRSESDAESEQFSLVIDHTWSPSSNQLLPTLSPPCLSDEQQWYLYSHIQQFCPEEVQDKIYPQP